MSTTELPPESVSSDDHAWRRIVVETWLSEPAGEDRYEAIKSLYPGGPVSTVAFIEGITLGVRSTLSVMMARIREHHMGYIVPKRLVDELTDEERDGIVRLWTRADEVSEMIDRLEAESA